MIAPGMYETRRLLRAITLCLSLTLLLNSQAVAGKPTHAFNAATEADARQWQESTRRKLSDLLKLDVFRDGPGEGTGVTFPLDSRIFFEGNTHQGRFINLTYQSTNHRRPLAVVTIPAGTGPFPAVVCIHGHSANRDGPYNANSAYHGFARELAASGFVTMALDVGSHRQHDESVSLTGQRVWDLIRAVDYLVSLPEVDKNRIGSAGLSLGGSLSMWLTAMDPRIRAAVVAGWMPTIQHLRQDDQCACWGVPGLEDTLDFPDIFGLIAPRPLMVQLGASDRDFPPHVARPSLRRVAATYETFGESEKLSLVLHDRGHEILPEPTVEFFRTVFEVPVPPPEGTPEAERKAPAPEATRADTNPPFELTVALGITAIAALGYALWLRRRLASRES